MQTCFCNSKKKVNVCCPTFSRSCYLNSVSSWEVEIMDSFVYVVVHDRDCPVHTGKSRQVTTCIQ